MSPAGKIRNGYMDETAYVVGEIEQERRRQVDGEGYKPAADLHYKTGQLERAAASYALSAAMSALGSAVMVQLLPWPWAPEWFKPKGPRDDLLRAGALIVAAIERHDREAALKPSEEG